MGDPAPAGGGDLGPLLEQFKALKKAVADLASPSGTQRGQVLADLVGRVSYSTTDASSQSWSTDQADNGEWGPSLTFTLTEARVVSIQFAVLGSANVFAGSNSSSAFATLRGMIFADGVGVGGSRGELSTNVGVAPTTYRQNSITNTLICTALITLPAGEHTVRGGFAQRYANTTGTPASSQITASNPSLFVDVKQTA